MGPWVFRKFPDSLHPIPFGEMNFTFNISVQTYQGLPRNHPAMKKARESVPKHKKGPRNEIKRPEQILKQRKIRDKAMSKNMGKSKKSKGKGKR